LNNLSYNIEIHYLLKICILV